jgi:type IV secretion system protein VirB10
MTLRLALTFLLCWATIFAQTGDPPDAQKAEDKGKVWEVPAGTRIPLTLINTVSSKNSEGDRIYLTTAFPILSGGRIVIPPGSYVAGTVTQVKRPGRVKGRGEIYVRFDSLTLENGTTRDFRARIGSFDGMASGEIDRNEGKIKSEGNKGGDARTVGEATAAGASVGVMAGSVAGSPGMGAGVGAAAGAASALAVVLMTRGPEAKLERGTTLEMVIDRTLTFEESELDEPTSKRRKIVENPTPASPTRKSREIPMPGRGLPL